MAECWNLFAAKKGETVQVLEISFRDVEKNKAIEALIRKKAAKLEQVCADLISCRIAVERPQRHQRSGNPYRIRIDLSVPGNEFVVTRKSSEGEMHDPLTKVLGVAFNAARRKLREYAKQQRGEVKTHPEQQTTALVVRLFPEEGYGFLKTPGGQEIYFHQNSVLHNDFDRLVIGTGVRFVAVEGEKGLQATTIQIIDKPRARVSKIDKPEIEPPLGWEE